MAVTEQSVYYGKNVRITITPRNGGAQYPDIFIKAEAYTRTHTVKYDDRYPLNQGRRDRHPIESNGTVEVTGPVCGAVQSSLTKAVDTAIKGKKPIPTFDAHIIGVGNDNTAFTDTLQICYPETDTQTATGNNKAVDAKLMFSYEHIV